MTHIFDTLEKYMKLNLSLEQLFDTIVAREKFLSIFVCACRASVTIACVGKLRRAYVPCVNACVGNLGVRAVRERLCRLLRSACRA